MGHRFPVCLPLAAALLLAATMNVHADKLADMRASVESSMRVSGTVDVDSEGRVSHYTVKDADAYPKGVLALVASRLPEWRFEPATVDGRAVPVEADMRLLLVAHKTGDDSYDIGIRSATFARDAPDGRDRRVSRANMGPPSYPESMNHFRVGGTVFLVLRVDRAGKVSDVFPEQTNLGVLAGPREMEAMRAAFERSALSAARRWTFVPPTSGPSAGDASWLVRVPVAYMAWHDSDATGKWRTYVPGPRHAAPWMQHDDVADTGIDALDPGAIYQVGQGLHLLTPLSAG